MNDIHDWLLRDLQREAALALIHYQPTIHEQGKWDQKAYHDSRQFYIAVIKDFMQEWHDIPSRIVKGNNE